MHVIEGEEFYAYYCCVICGTDHWLDGVQTRNNEDGSATLCFGKAACEAPSFSLRTAGVYGISDGVTGDERGLVFYHVNDYENALKQIPQK